MLQLRFVYGILIFVVIGLGLASRQFPMVPQGVGDALWAMMIFLILRFFCVKSLLAVIASCSLVICYGVEVSQLYHEPWIDQIRSSKLGGLVLGRGFLWTDIMAYTIGIFICIFAENIVRGKA